MEKYVGNDEFCKSSIKKFEEENKEFVSNKIIISFLNIPQHREIYYQTICNPTNENKDLLDKLFKSFYFEIRFTSHISSTLHFNAINHDKRSRTLNNRFNLTLDSTINSEDGETSFKDLLADENESDIVDKIVQGSDLLEHIECPTLYEAIKLLSEKQLEIIQLVYVHGFTDTEVSKILNKSQQTISKTHKKALTTLYNYISNKSTV